jgi:hypothetical protein
MMLFLLYNCVIYLLSLIMCVSGQFHLYESSDETIKSDYDRDCLDFYPTKELVFSDFDNLYQQHHQIIPFCRRDNMNDGTMVIGYNISSFTFDELTKRNVSSEDLIGWSASIELVEDYQAYLERKNHQLASAVSLQFHNCSPTGRFGYFCQYYFQLNVSRS